MAIDLYDLVPYVRSSLSDVPSEFLSDDQAYNELLKAQAFCEAVCLTTTSEAYLSKCIQVVGTYYAYINYTSLSERQLGTLPPTSLIRVNALKSVAVGFLQVVSIYPLTEDLTIDTKTFERTNVGYVVPLTTVIDYDYLD